MTVYRGMDIGTAKPSPDERATVPHHLIDIVDPSVEYSVAQYVDAAAATVADIRSRGKEPLFVGGTPLYLKSLLRGLFDGPPADWQMRHEIEQELRARRPAGALRSAAADRSGGSVAHSSARQAAVDSGVGSPPRDWPADQSSATCNSRRVGQRTSVAFSCCDVRARSCIGGSKSAFGRWSVPDSSTRFDELTSVGELGRTARQAVGYREAIAYLAGEYDHDEMVARITYRTRRFAKRQGTWFRSLSECRFVDIAGEVDAEAVAARYRGCGELARRKQWASGRLSRNCDSLRDFTRCFP